MRLANDEGPVVGVVDEDVAAVVAAVIVAAEEEDVFGLMTCITLLPLPPDEEVGRGPRGT